MNKRIYATKNSVAIFGFNAHAEQVLSPDADAISHSGGDPFITNPDYIEGAGFDMPEDKLMHLLDQLYIKRDVREFDPQILLEKCDAYLTALIAITTDDYYGRRAMGLHSIAKTALAHGADKIVAT